MYTNRDYMTVDRRLFSLEFYTVLPAETLRKFYRRFELPYYFYHLNHNIPLDQYYFAIQELNAI